MLLLYHNLEYYGRGYGKGIFKLNSFSGGYSHKGTLPCEYIGPIYSSINKKQLHRLANRRANASFPKMEYAITINEKQKMFRDNYATSC